PIVSPTHSTPLVNSSAERRMRISAPTSSIQSTRFVPSQRHRRSVALPSAVVDARGFLNRLLAEDGSEACLAHVEVLAAREPAALPLPDLPEVLRLRLSGAGVEGLYPHQLQALELLDHGDNVVVATGTASGKTLVYNLAFAKAALADEKCTALYLFPTKALARDQLRQVRELKLPQIRAGVYDGDTPQ